MEDMWLTECESFSSTKEFYGYYVDEFNPHHYPYVIYYYKSGSIIRIAIFFDDASFDRACQYIGLYFTS